MGYALRLASEVRQALGELPIDVQEHVLDFFEQLAVDPGLADPGDEPRFENHRLTYVGVEIAILRLGVVIDDGSRTVVVRRLRYVIVR